MKTKNLIGIFLTLITLGLIGSLLIPVLVFSPLNSHTDDPITPIRTSAISYENATVISDDLTGWNDINSKNPSIAIDSEGNIHVVWDDTTQGWWNPSGSDSEIFYCNYTSTNGWSNATVISDDKTNWNSDYSKDPEIAVDEDDNIHVVWEDDTDGAWWGNDKEIMYTRNLGYGWSDAIVISDDNTGWNDGYSRNPSIAVDNHNKVHVVWDDETLGPWGGDPNDKEIMYTYNEGLGFLNATIISDNESDWYYGESSEPSIVIDNNNHPHVVWKDWHKFHLIGGNDYDIWYSNKIGSEWSVPDVISDDTTIWNKGTSDAPEMAIDSQNNLHVVWSDYTDGWWGTDWEIMYTTNTGGSWSNATIISDDTTNWNNETSYFPKIGIDFADNIHVVWYDDTDGGWWGNDQEIMYSRNMGSGWTNATIISDDSTSWNDGDSKNPSISLLDGNAYIVWEDGTDGDWWGFDWEIMITTVMRDDMTPPAWSLLPVNQQIEKKDSLTCTVSAMDDSGIGSYWINDTSYFQINTTSGLITNKFTIPVGEYWIKIYVDDIYGNTNSTAVKVTVTVTSPPSGGDEIPGYSLIVVIPIVILSVGAFILKYRKRFLS